MVHLAGVAPFIEFPGSPHSVTSVDISLAGRAAKEAGKCILFSGPSTDHSELKLSVLARKVEKWVLGRYELSSLLVLRNDHLLSLY